MAATYIAEDDLTRPNSTAATSSAPRVGPEAKWASATATIPSKIFEKPIAREAGRRPCAHTRKYQGILELAGTMTLWRDRSAKRTWVDRRRMRHVLRQPRLKTLDRTHELSLSLLPLQLDLWLCKPACYPAFQPDNALHALTLSRDSESTRWKSGIGFSLCGISEYRRGKRRSASKASSIGTSSERLRH